MGVLDYLIVKPKSSQNLTNKVRALMTEGWVPTGNHVDFGNTQVAAIQIKEPWLQTMVKYQ